MAMRLVWVSLLLTAVVLGAMALFRELYPQAAPPAASEMPKKEAPVLVPLPQQAPLPVAASASANAPANLGNVRVLKANGLLETRSAQEEAWRKLTQGDRLTVEDRVRTGRNAMAVLQVGEAGKIQLAARSELTFRKVSGDVVRVRLEEGRLTAEAEEGSGKLLQVETAGSDATAESHVGRFTMMSDGRGQVAVATETGRVRFRALGREVEVTAGKTSLVSGKAAPTPPTKVPTSLLLKVVPPARAVQRETEHELVGRVTPGSFVRANGRPVHPDAQGHFRLKVPLNEGRNAIEVVAVDALGREKATLLDITVDSKAPSLKGVMTWGQSE
jgi:hypothetical protein